MAAPSLALWQKGDGPIAQVSQSVSDSLTHYPLTMQRQDKVSVETPKGGTTSGALEMASLPQTLQGDEVRLAAAIESLLFVAGRPLEHNELRKVLGVSEEELQKGLHALARTLEEQRRGLRLQRLGTQVQLVTAPENARYVAALLGLPLTARLTPAALETLAVICYRQPITRAQIEAIRGVNSDRALASLIQHGLVAEVGRAPTVGHPALFATTPEFLQQFGLTSLDELPHIDGLPDVQRAVQALQERLPLSEGAAASDSLREQAP